MDVQQICHKRFPNRYENIIILAAAISFQYMQNLRKEGGKLTIPALPEETVRFFVWGTKHNRKIVPVSRNRRRRLKGGTERENVNTATTVTVGLQSPCRYRRFFHFPMRRNNCQITGTPLKTPFDSIY